MKNFTKAAPNGDQAKAEAINYLEADYEDIIFLERNKAYGAYRLRKEYPGNLTKSTLIAIVALLLLVNIPNIAKALMAGNVEPELLSGEFVTTEYVAPTKKDLPPVLPPTAKEAAAPKKATVKIAVPKVVDESEAILDADLPNMDELRHVEIGPTTTDGDPFGLPLGLEDDLPEANLTSTVAEKQLPLREEKPFTIVEQMPAFPDGQAALLKFLAKNITYPSFARDNDIEGNVYVSFVVEKDGSISNITIEGDIGGGCGMEAVKVVKMMPNWLPGKQRGEPVRVKFNLPIKFRIN